MIFSWATDPKFNDFAMIFSFFTNFKNVSSNSMIFPWSWNRSEFQWFFKSCGNRLRAAWSQLKIYSPLGSLFWTPAGLRRAAMGARICETRLLQLVESHFLTWPLTGSWLCCQPIRNHVGIVGYQQFQQIMMVMPFITYCYCNNLVGTHSED